MAPLPRLLLAEDDPISRSFLQQALTDRYAVALAVDGQQALHAARQQPFDALLLDLNLPRLSGSDVLTALRDDPQAASRHSPALALTADLRPEVEQRLRADGFVLALSKPLSVTDLLHGVATLLDEASRLQRPDSATPSSGLIGIDDESGMTLSDWDEAAALRSAGHDPSIVAALRQLLRAELPAQLQRIEQALARAELRSAGDELHRLRASCGFCGAARLAQAVDRLDQHLSAGTPHQIALQTMQHAVQALLNG